MAINLRPHDIGDCGKSQWMHAGTVKFNDTGVATGIKLCDVPMRSLIVRAVAVVNTEFNAGTTNVLTIGTNDDVNNLLGTSDITEGTAGNYSKDTFVHCASKTAVKAKFTETGTDATTGEADIYLEIVRCPE